MKNNNELNYDAVIVIGGTGQTGQRLLELLIAAQQKQPNLQILATSRKVQHNQPAGDLAETLAPSIVENQHLVKWLELNLEANSQELLHSIASFPSQLNRVAIMVTAAFTNVDGCEVDPVKCATINQQNTIKVIESFAQRYHETKVVFYSTDYVFDGTQGPYLESAVAGAIQVYGQSKQLVESWLQSNLPSSLIVRTTGVYDCLPGSKNFFMQMQTLWGAGTKTRIPHDQSSNPVWAYELAKATLDLLVKNSFGVFHVAGGEYYNRDDFAKLIAEEFGFDVNLIESVATIDLKQKAKRPLRGGLVCEKLQKEIGWAPRGAHAVFKTFKQLK